MELNPRVGARAQSRPLRYAEFRCEGMIKYRGMTTLENFSTAIVDLSSMFSRALPDTAKKAHDQSMLLDRAPKSQYKRASYGDYYFKKNNIVSGNVCKFALTNQEEQQCRHLFLGYDNGFQIWNVQDPSNVYEIASVYSNLPPSPTTPPLPGTIKTLPIGPVKDIYPLLFDPELIASQEIKENMPMVALLTEVMTRERNGYNSSFSLPSVVLYSLKKKQIFRALDLPESFFSAKISCNKFALVVASSLGEYLIYSHKDLDLNARFDQNLVKPAASGTPAPNFALGDRWIAYTTTDPPSLLINSSNSIVAKNLKKLVVQQEDKSTEADDKISSTVANAATEVAKEVVNGVKLLGGLGYRKMSDWYLGRSPPRFSTGSNNSSLSGSPSFQRYAENSAKNSPKISNSRISNNQQIISTGNIIVRDLGSEGCPLVCHFRAHERDCTALAFDESGQFLATASSRGDTFKIWSVASSLSRRMQQHGAVRLLRVFSRGYTHAVITQLQFDPENVWFSSSTARGTTHVFRMDEDQDLEDLNYSVSPREHFHFINSSKSRPFSQHTSQPTNEPPARSPKYAIIRIKQAGSTSTIDEDDTAEEEENHRVGPLCWFGKKVNGAKELFVFSTRGGGKMTLHRLRETTKIIKNTTEIVENVAEWKLNREHDWPAFVLDIPTGMAKTISASYSGELSSQGNHIETTWLKNAEINVYPPSHVRYTLWKFTWFTFQAFKSGEPESSKDHQIPAEPIPVKKAAPTPYGWAIGENGGSVPSAEIQERISNAISTTLERQPFPMFPGSDQHEEEEEEVEEDEEIFYPKRQLLFLPRSESPGNNVIPGLNSNMFTNYNQPSLLSSSSSKQNGTGYFEYSSPPSYSYSNTTTPMTNTPSTTNNHHSRDQSDTILTDVSLTTSPPPAPPPLMQSREYEKEQYLPRFGEDDPFASLLDDD